MSVRPSSVFIALVLALAGWAGSVAANEEKPATASTTTKRLITLPPIDRNNLEKPTDLKPGEKFGGVVAGTATKAEPKAEPKNANKMEAPAISKPTSRTSTSAEILEQITARMAATASSRHQREIALATTGPRRTSASTSRKTTATRLESTASASLAALEQHKHIHWSYEGDGGPSEWSKIDGANTSCAVGQRQSPIDITSGNLIKVDLENIKFNYRPSHFRIEDNGHTIQVTLGEGNTITVQGQAYELKQFHFHRPSEEKIGGQRFDMVAHLVHKNDEGQLAVVAVLLQAGGAEQALIQTLWNNLPLEKGKSNSPETLIDLNNLLPQGRQYYTYMGSLTTPPCSENVLWMVFKEPVWLSSDQVMTFSRLYNNNARPIQPANGRLVKESR